MVVNKDLPVKSVADLIALAKSKPNGLNYGSGGPGSMHHLSTELLESLAGIQMTHVPYKATPPAMNDLLAGHIQVLFGDTTSVLPFIRQGTVRPPGQLSRVRANDGREVLQFDYPTGDSQMRKFSKWAKRGLLVLSPLPLVIATLIPAFRRRWEKHSRIAKWTMPIWLYVSVTGVIIYWMLYHLFPRVPGARLAEVHAKIAPELARLGAPVFDGYLRVFYGALREGPTYVEDNAFLRRGPAP